MIRRNWIIFATIGFGVLPGLASRAVMAGGPTPPSPCPTCAPCPVCTPCAAASPLPPPLTPAEAKKLLGEFVKAQKIEMKALEHRQKIELRELKASQSARFKDWNRNEADARHAFQKTHHQGKEMRAYIQDFSARRDVLRSMQADEIKQRGSEQGVRRKALEGEQAQKLKEAQGFLSKGQRLPDTLWPAAGR